jgi:hypothetical protein
VGRFDYIRSKRELDDIDAEDFVDVDCLGAYQDVG